MKKLPISIQTFEKIRTEDYLYIDKTKYIYELSQTGTFYLLSRPRRFGKSLLLSTFKSLFEGRSDLFKGLFIHTKIKDWKKHPIIYIDYSLIAYHSGKELFSASLLAYLQAIAQQYKLQIKETIIPNFFTALVRQLHQQYGQVVILVDEYDKPLVDTLTDEAIFQENRTVLNSFYGSIKGLEAHLRFVFLTGVSRFSKVGIFSGMNNLNDITLDTSFASIVGFTQAEVSTHFPQYISALSKEFDLTETQILAHIKDWYNGFSWDGLTRLYNPFSILNLFQKKTFDNYWFSTGTPSFLMKLIKAQKQLPTEFEKIVVSDLRGSSMHYQTLPLYPLLFQTGYLTIEKINKEGIEKNYQLNYPNKEVRQSFLTFILAAFVDKEEFLIQPEVIQLKKALSTGDTQGFISLIQSFIADIPGRLHLPKEAYYHSLVYLLLRLVGMKMLLEKETSKGRIDALLEFPNKVYIIEFKFATNKRIKNIKTLTKQALQQIHDKAYYEPWQGSGKQIILMGIGFLNKVVDGRVEVL